MFSSFFFFNDTATTEIYTLSLHDALPISRALHSSQGDFHHKGAVIGAEVAGPFGGDISIRGDALRGGAKSVADRSEEHTSELQSLAYLVCRLLLEKKKKNKKVRYELIYEL